MSTRWLPMRCSYCENEISHLCQLMLESSYDTDRICGVKRVYLMDILPVRRTSRWESRLRVGQ